MALFDTDILIDHLRGIKQAKDTLLKFIYEQNYISVITVGEILFGMQKSEEEKTFTLLNSFVELPVDKETIRTAHQIKLMIKTHKLFLYDCIIAATALKYNQILVTRNKKHYPDKRIKLFIPDY